MATGGPRALLVGIGKYSFAPNLESPQNDIAQMRNLLHLHFGFSPQNITVLRDGQATRQAILTHLRLLAANSNPKDPVIFYFSGFGSRKIDDSGDERDGWDETLVPCDGRDPQDLIADLDDDLLNREFNNIAARCRTLTVIADSGFREPSRQAAPYGKFLQEDRRFNQRSWHPKPEKRLFYDGLRDTGAKFHAIGCSPGPQGTLEIAFGPQKMGALTFGLTSALRAAPKAVRYRDTIDGIATRIWRHLPEVNPQFNGMAMSHQVFGVNKPAARQDIAVKPLAPGKLRFAAGAVHGLTKGSRYAIYAGNENTHLRQPLAMVTLKKVSAFEASADLPLKSVIPQPAIAVEHHHQYGDQQLYVHIQPCPHPNWAQTLRKELAEYTVIRFIKSTKQDHHLKVAHQCSGGQIVLQNENRRLVEPAMTMRQPHNAAYAASRLLARAKWFNTLSLHNGSQLTGGVEIHLETAQGKARSPFLFIPGHKATFTAGEEVVCKMTNKSGLLVYITVVNLAENGSIRVIDPEHPRNAKPLKPGAFAIRRFPSYLPAGKAACRDILKFFITLEPVDLRALNQDLAPARSYRGKPRGDHPLEQLAGSLEPALGLAGARAKWGAIDRTILIVAPQTRMP